MTASYHTYKSPSKHLSRKLILRQLNRTVEKHTKFAHVLYFLLCLNLLECPIFNFEHGADDWSRQGSAFAYQPIFGGSSNVGHQGNWLIDSYRNVTTPCQRRNSSIGVQATGTMTSPPFVIRSATLSFLIGGKKFCHVTTPNIHKN